MSLVGPEHGFPAEASEYWIGTPRLASSTRPSGLTCRPYRPTSGLIVNDVVKDSPADQDLRARRTTSWSSMDGKPLADADALIAQIQASQGKPVPLQPPSEAASRSRS